LEICLRIGEKKSVKSKFGLLEISKSNSFLPKEGESKVTPYLQDLLVFIGQMESYELGSETAEKLLGLAINDTLIFRLTDRIGQLSDSWLKEDGLRKKMQTNESEMIYVQVDGSMVLTREDSWKEIKLGRVFKASNILNESKNRKYLKDSEYAAYLGSHLTFENKMSNIVDEYVSKNKNLVFIMDGAKWQWSWVKAEYPKATQILDFYHAMDHIGSFFKLLRKTPSEISEIANILKQEGVESVIKLIMAEDCTSEKKKNERMNLLSYLKSNLERMDYPSYIKRNLLIGSGAIESAHRNVLQKRMKLSGQRWSFSGAQNMINLRVLNFSGYWDRLTQHLRAA